MSFLNGPDSLVGRLGRRVILLGVLTARLTGRQIGLYCRGPAPADPGYSKQRRRRRGSGNNCLIMEWKVRWALESITTNKASGGDGIPVELFQILKDDAVKVLYSICQQIWKTQQWPQDWKRSVFIPIPKKGNAKKRANYHTIALISHGSKVML